MSKTTKEMTKRKPSRTNHQKSFFKKKKKKLNNLYTATFAFRTHTHAFAWDDSVVFSFKVTKMVREGMHEFLI